jgi:hypothetical protein
VAYLHLVEGILIHDVSKLVVAVRSQAYLDTRPAQISQSSHDGRHGVVYSMASEVKTELSLNGLD